MRPISILFLCTGNSARSIIAEGLTNHLGDGKYVAYSAGSQPTGVVNPLAIDVLHAHGVDQDFKSQSWNDFTAEDSPEIDIVVTVCDNAAAELCPRFQGTPKHLHWSLEDPAAVGGSDEEKYTSFENTFNAIIGRIKNGALEA